MVEDKESKKATLSDLNLVKVQIYTEQRHTRLTLLLTFIFSLLLTFSVVFYTLLSEGLVSMLQFWVAFVFLYGMCFLYLSSSVRDYNRDFRRISDMLEMVKEGKELPKLEELGKIGERDRVSVESEKEPESQIPNTESFATRTGALLDFYSDRAVAHASFFVASVFGLVTILAIIQQLENGFWVWFSVMLFSTFSYTGYYTLFRFSFYADISQKLSEHGLESEKVFAGIPYEKGTLKSYMDNQEDLQKKYLILKRIIARKQGKYIFALLYWVLIFCLGSVVYSKFWHSWIERIGWFGFLLIFVFVFVISPWLYYRKSKENKE